MGQKIHPKLFRLSTIYRWDSKWFARKKNLIPFLREDVLIREFLLKELHHASVDHVSIDRNSNDVRVSIFSAKPGYIIGRQGAGIEDLKKKIKSQFYRGKKVQVHLNIQEVARPNLSARITGLQIAQEIEKRMPFRRSMKMAAERVMKSGAKGVKVMIAGRLNGAEIARSETTSEGSIPLHNLRADVDFSRVTARTIYGAIGIKVWIYKGEVFGDEPVEREVRKRPQRRNNRNSN